MKITDMLARGEQFYEVNKQTLDSYFSQSGEKTELFIYPQINAIVTRKPSKKVCEYLMTEFSVRGSVIKRIAVKAYVFLVLHSFGIFASKRIVVNSNLSSEKLIYPCNKKYRIFDFEKMEVTVIPKYGFDNSDFKHEIDFRKREEHPDFVPGFLDYSDKEYVERIIDGKPLARETVRFEFFRDEVFRIFNENIESTKRKIDTKEYFKSLSEKKNILLKENKDLNDIVDYVWNKLIDIPFEEDIEVAFSHGDLQSGNIWIENTTQKLFIIDWESFGERSLLYDKACLFYGLRPFGPKHFFNTCAELKEEKAVVLLEDIIFNIENMIHLPKEFARNGFIKYIDEIREIVDEQF